MLLHNSSRLSLYSVGLNETSEQIYQILNIHNTKTTLYGTWKVNTFKKKTRMRLVKHLLQSKTFKVNIIWTKEVISKFESHMISGFFLANFTCDWINLKSVLPIYTSYWQAMHQIASLCNMIYCLKEYVPYLLLHMGCSFNHWLEHKK